MKQTAPHFDAEVCYPFLLVKCEMPVDHEARHGGTAFDLFTLLLDAISKAGRDDALNLYDVLSKTASLAKLRSESKNALELDVIAEGALDAIGYSPDRPDHHP